MSGGSIHGQASAPNRLARDFQAAAPNQVWCPALGYISPAEAERRAA